MFSATDTHLYVEQERLKNELKDFGNRVKVLREQQGLTKTQLAFEMGTGEKYIRELEKGNINITFKNLIKLASCLNIKPEILLVKE